MSYVRKVNDLEIAEDPEFQRRTWAWQRAAWAVMAATILAALAGLFGDGPLSRASVGGDGGSARVSYRRFARRQSESTVEVELAPGPGGEARVWVDRDYADGADIRQVDPAPSRVELTPDGMTYVITTPGGGRPVRVQLHLYPERPGALRGRVRAGDGPTLGFTQLIYP